MTTLYRWPGGTLDEIRPLDADEVQELSDLLGKLLDERAINTINMAFVALEERVSHDSSGKSRTTIDAEARPLVDLLASDGAMDKLAWTLGLKKAELAWKIRLAGHTIVNSFADHK